MTTLPADPHAPAPRRSLSLGNFIVPGTIPLTAIIGTYGVLSNNTGGHVVSTFFLVLVVWLFTFVSYSPTARVYPA